MTRCLTLSLLLLTACLKPVDVVGRACLDGACPEGLQCVQARCVVPTSTFTPPYQLPEPGHVVTIGTNTAEQVAPKEISASKWNETLFRGWGGGCFVADWSAGGAYVFAGKGGEGYAPLFGAVLFDFADATWKRVDNTNGQAHRSTDLTESETNGAPNYEIALPGVTPDQMPAPTFTYENLMELPAARGGGEKGSVVLALSPSATTTGQTGFRAHRFDLATGKWTRWSTNVLSDLVDRRYFSLDSVTVFDAETSRFYQFPTLVHGVNQLPYLDLADQTWKLARRFDAYPVELGSTHTGFVHGRVLVTVDSTDVLRLYQLERLQSGPTTAKLTGTMLDDNRWVFYPADGRYYSYSGSGQRLRRLTAPADPLTGTWVVDEVELNDPLPPAAATASSPRHYTRLFYVPALGVLAWVAGDNADVALLRPP